jgi:hypothetical protein
VLQPFGIITPAPRIERFVAIVVMRHDVLFRLCCVDADLLRLIRTRMGAQGRHIVLTFMNNPDQ